MSLWWLEPGWGSARCACGVNIQQSGGDPDWGECYECFTERLHGNMLQEQYEEKAVEVEDSEHLGRQG